MNICNILKNKNHTNIIISNAFINLYEYITNIIHNKYNNFNKYKQYYNLIKYDKHENYIGIDCYNLKYDIILFIKELQNTIIFKNETYYIIFYNFQYIKIEIQNALKVFYEKANIFKFIICTNNLNKIIKPIKSRCIYIHIKSNIKDKGILYNDIIHYIYKNIFIKFYAENTLFKKIKEISMLIISSNINYIDFIKCFIYYISKKPYIINKHKHEVIQNICDLENKYNKSYYKLIYYEYSILTIYNIIYNSIYCYYLLI